MQFLHSSPRSGSASLGSGNTSMGLCAQYPTSLPPCSPLHPQILPRRRHRRCPLVLKMRQPHWVQRLGGDIRSHVIHSHFTAPDDRVQSVRPGRATIPKPADPSNFLPHTLFFLPAFSLPLAPISDQASASSLCWRKKCIDHSFSPPHHSRS